jgi:anti-sigma B factor antagonist
MSYHLTETGGSGDETTIVLRGELDMRAAPALRDALKRAIGGRVPRVIVDLTDATFLDSTAIGALLVASQQIRDSGGRLRLICANKNVLRTVEIAGLGRHILVAPTVGEASQRELWLAADPTELAETRRLADEAAASYGLKEPERFAFAFAVNEAVSNAIEHGSPSPEGTIRLLFTEEMDALVFRVQDYGAFTPAAGTHDQPSSRGRGLVLMATMVDELNLCRGSTGTLVRLSKRRRPTACVR